MIRYKTVAKEASAETVIEKSRFIAYIRPVNDRDEADRFIASVRSRHRDATHNVPAMVIGEKMQIQWASDDGEPQGTSGAPMVQLLVKEGVTNVVVVVTRYFGGVKLGTGGLVRAYTGSVKLALDAAGVCSVMDLSLTKARLEYTHLAKLQSAEKLPGSIFDIRDIEYAEAVTVTLASEPENTPKLHGLLANLTNGTAKIISEQTVLAKV